MAKMMPTSMISQKITPKNWKINENISIRITIAKLGVWCSRMRLFTIMPVENISQKSNLHERIEVQHISLHVSVRKSLYKCLQKEIPSTRTFFRAICRREKLWPLSTSIKHGVKSMKHVQTLTIASSFRSVALLSLIYNLALSKKSTHIRHINTLSHTLFAC